MCLAILVQICWLVRCFHYSSEKFADVAQECNASTVAMAINRNSRRKISNIRDNGQVYVSC